MISGWLAEPRKLHDAFSVLLLLQLLQLLLLLLLVDVAVAVVVAAVVAVDGTVVVAVANHYMAYESNQM